MSDDHSARNTLLDRISDAFDDDIAAIPSQLTAAAIDAFSWRLVDARLAELLFDSSLDDLVGIRGTSTERRSFRFGADDFVIRVHLTPATMIVMIEPPLSVVCRLSTEGGSVEHRTDELGEIVVDAPELPVRIEVDLPGGTVVTPWITG
ncbi:MAG: hypothetical protein ABIO83_07485 [Ilumatobacteraceae bacterium]